MLVPKLRFKEFTNEWNYFEIGKLFTNKSKSYNPNINNERLKCIELENINQESGTINSYILSISQKSNKNIFNINEVLFGKLRPYLKKYWYTNFKGVCSSEIWVLKTLNDEVLINHFIFYLIQSHYFLQLCNLSTGSKMPRADWNYICNQFIGIPKINEQERIANFLSLLDKKIELQSKKIEALKLYSESTKNNFFDSILNCELISLKKILKERKTFSQKGLEYPHVTLSKDGIYDKGERYNRDFLVKSEDKKYKITFLNDLCYNPANLKFGVICLNEYGSAIFSPIYVTYEINKNINPNYIAYYLTRNVFIKQARKYEQGTVFERMSVSPEDFVKFKVPIPSRAAQDQIVEHIKKINNKLLLEEDKLQLLIKYKKGLMQKMFV